MASSSSVAEESIVSVESRELGEGVASSSVPISSFSPAIPVLLAYTGSVPALFEVLRARNIPDWSARTDLVNTEYRFILTPGRDRVFFNPLFPTSNYFACLSKRLEDTASEEETPKIRLGGAPNEPPHPVTPIDLQSLVALVYYYKTFGAEDRDCTAAAFLVLNDATIADIDVLEFFDVERSKHERVPLTHRTLYNLAIDNFFITRRPAVDKNFVLMLLRSHMMVAFEQSCKDAADASEMGTRIEDIQFNQGSFAELFSAQNVFMVAGAWYLQVPTRIFLAFYFVSLLMQHGVAWSKNRDCFV